MATEVDRLIVTLEARVTQFEKAMQKAVRDANTTSTKISKAFKGVDDSFSRMGRNAVAAIGGAVLAREIVRLADSYSNLEAKLRLVTNSDAERINLQKQLHALANATRTDLSSTVTLYSRLSNSARALGLNQKDLLRLTDSINKSFQISGATASEAASGVIQLSQGLASGVLRGDEFNSMMENAPDLARRLSESLGQPLGSLREMAEAGELTSQVVIKALQRIGPAVDADFAKIPRTIAGAMSQLSNDLLMQIGGANNSAGATSALTSALDAMREIMKDSSFQSGIHVIATGIGDIGEAAAGALQFIGKLNDSLKG